MWILFVLMGFAVGIIAAFLFDCGCNSCSDPDTEERLKYDAGDEDYVVDSELDEDSEEESKQDVVHKEKIVQPKSIHQYVVFKEHIDKCNFSKEEWENLWWDQDEVPNTEEDGGLYRFYYEFEEMFDTMDPGLITGQTTEKYLLTIYDEEAYEKYPLVKRLYNLRLPEYDKDICKKYMSPEEIRAYIDSANVNKS